MAYKRKRIPYKSPYRTETPKADNPFSFESRPGERGNDIANAFGNPPDVPADKLTRRTFASWGEFVDFAEQPKNPDYSGEPQSHLTGSYSDWNGTKTWEDSIKLARHGWKDMADKIQAAAMPLFSRLSNAIMKPEPVYVTEGRVLDVGRWIEGEPEHWIEMHDSETMSVGQRIASIVYNSSASCGVSKETMLAKGAVIATLVRLLEFADFRVNLEVVYALSDSPSFSGDYNQANWLEHRVMVKRAEQDLDMDLVTYALCHASAFRRQAFAAWEQEPKELLNRFSISQYGCYSCPANATRMDKQAFHIPASGSWDYEWSNPASAEKFIMDNLVKFGVTVREV